MTEFFNGVPVWALQNTAAYELSRKIDNQVLSAIKEKTKVGYWLITKFKSKFIARLLRLKLEVHRSNASMSRIYKVFVWGKVVRTFEISDIEFIRI